MNANQEVEQAIARQASEWVTVLRRTTTRAELASFAEWIKTSPRHMRDFLLMSAIETELHHVDAPRRYGAHELLDDAPSNVTPLQNALNGGGAARTEHPAPVREWPSWLRPASWAAALVALAGTAALMLWPPDFLSGWKTYATATGEQRAIELDDGSIVHLNTRSQIKVRVGNDAREIRLLAGEALFKVHRDPARTFRVYTPDAAIQALGTQFNVYRRPEGTTVVVLEGKVRISSGEQPSDAGQRKVSAGIEAAKALATPFTAGESAYIDTRGTVSRERTVVPGSAVAWQQRRLEFQKAPLSEIAREFNRYNTAPKFRLEGAAVEARHYTGLFDADDPESLVELLEAEPGLNVTRIGDDILVSAPGEASEKARADAHRRR